MTTTTTPANYGGVYCPEHPHAQLVEDYSAGDQICPECGLVVGDRVIDVGVEWRTFGDDSSSSCRVGGAESLLNGAMFSTTVCGSGEKGAIMGFEDLQMMRRTRISSMERSLLSGFEEIGQMGVRLNLPRPIVDGAKSIFKMVKDRDGLRGRSGDAIASACIYLSCRREGAPRTFKEICGVSKVSEKRIRRCLKPILAELRSSLESVSVARITCEDFMPRFCSKLALPNSVEKAATAIAERAVQLELVDGRSPISIAAGAIYMACQATGKKRSQVEIGQVAGVSDSSIRRTYRRMIPRAPELFPKDFDFCIPIEQVPGV